MSSDKEKSNNHLLSNNERCKQLAILNEKVAWDTLVDEVFPYYMNARIEGLTLTLESMVRLHILLRHLDLSPIQLEEELFQHSELREFALIDSKYDIPSSEVITNFSSIMFEQGLILKIEHALRQL